MRKRLPWIGLGLLIGLGVFGPMVALSGQTAMDKAVTRLAGLPFTEIYDLDARLDLVEAGVPATEVVFAPESAGDWVNPDPTTAAQALNVGIARVVVVEALLAFTPGNLAHWTGGVDPGNMVVALNQIAQRLAAAETTLLTFANVLADLTSLDSRLDALSAQILRFEVTASAEGAGAANSFDLTIVVRDLEGNNLGGAVQFMVAVYAESFLETGETDNNFPITDAGTGIIVDTSTNTARVLCLTEALAGVQTSVLRIQDASGALAGAKYVLVTPWNFNSNKPASAPIRVQLIWA